MCQEYVRDLEKEEEEQRKLRMVPNKMHYVVCALKFDALPYLLHSFVN